MFIFIYYIRFEIWNGIFLRTYYIYYFSFKLKFVKE
jgi:hypothetical protein